MLKKIYITLITLLIILLPLINSSLTELFWIKLGLNVNWNYEFTKVIFFNIFTSIILVFFILDKIIYKKNIKIPTIIFYIFWVFSISTYLSISPYISFFWNSAKAHWFLMFLNLISLFILLINLKKSEKENILKYSVIGLIFTSIIAIWQLYFPTFNYWNLSNRALWTFWHPNYLALYLLIYIPLLYKNKIFINKEQFKKLKEAFKYNTQISNIIKLKFKFIFNILYIIYNTVLLLLLNPVLILTIVIITLFLTKSIFAIILIFLYSIYFFYKEINKKNKKIFLFLIFLFFLISIFIILYSFWYTKLHSFFSRFYIWKTTVLISFDSIKSFLFGHWFETLNLIFDKNKSPFLYIFENIWFSADRPHNLILLFFYTTWIFWLIVIFIILKYILNLKNSVYKDSLILTIIFLMFNFASITSYLLIILLLSITYKDKKITNSKEINFIFVIILTLISIYWAYNSYLFYKAENSIKKWIYRNITQIYKYNPDYYIKNWDFENWLKYNKIKSEIYYKSKIYYQKDINNWCIELTNNYPSVENHFFCWDLYWELWQKDIAKTYYNIWLNKLPDLWNKDSKYYQYKIIKETINWNRFFSPKYSNLLQILKRVWIKK